MIRWTIARKAKIIDEVSKNPEEQGAILERNGISQEEFSIWCKRFGPHGISGLKTTRISDFRRCESAKW